MSFVPFLRPLISTTMTMGTHSFNLTESHDRYSYNFITIFIYYCPEISFEV